MSAILRNIISRTRQGSLLFQLCKDEKVITRSYLTQAYQCLEAWNNRSNEDLVKLVGKPNEFFIILDQKFKREFRIWPADVDLYVASLSSDGSNWTPEEIEDLLSKLGGSGDRWSMLDSTAHNVFRLLLQNNHTESLFRIMTQPQSYATFMDQHVANLLMDHYLDQHDYTHAARVAAELMLAEDFGRPLNQLFILCSCLKWAHNRDSNKEWIDYTPIIPEPEEDVKIRHDFYPNPFFDDHFHLKEDALLVGKTLAWCAERCFQPGDLRTNSLLLGWALYRKWDKLAAVITRVQSGQETGVTAASTASMVRELINQYCVEESLKESLLEGVDGLAIDSEYNLVTAVETALLKQVALDEKTEVESQELMYKRFAEERMLTMEKLEDVGKRKRLLEEIAEKKEYLKKKEQLLYYFDNENKIDLTIDGIDKEDDLFSERADSKSARRRVVQQDGDYIPPQLRRTLN